MAGANTPAASSQPYIYEVDLMRALTAFTVVAIHAVSTMGFLVTGTKSVQLFNLVVHALHYNREVFVFITGLVLTYVYRAKPNFSVKQFYRKRFYLIFVPYVLWTIIYTLVHNHSFFSIGYVQLIAWNVLTGKASPQLYYIIMALQIYLLFPLFLLFIRKVQRWPWRTLAIALGVQLGLVYLDFHYIQTGPLRQYALVNHFLNYQDRLVPAYGFFLLLGGIAAVYMQQIRDFYKKYGRYVPLVMLAALLLYVLYFYAELNQLHNPMSHATTVLQPSVVMYSTVVIFFFSWFSLLWAKKRALYKLIKPLSDMSFGIFFVHFIFLSLVAYRLLPLVPFGMPVAVEILAVVLATFALSAACCYLLLKVSFLSWTIGKPGTDSQKVPVQLPQSEAASP